MDQERLHQRAREQGANPIAYAIVRILFQPVFHLYFRYTRIGREHIPRRGPVIIASNHRSFLDPFVIATMARRPMYYVAKKELFRNRLQGWLLNALGAFPVDRGAADGDMIETAKAILARGDIVLIFPEGTRTRPGALGRPRRGVGRLALETGAPVVPGAVIGAGAWGTALAALLARAGFEVELGCRTKEQADAIAETRVNERHLPGVELPDQLRVVRASELNLEGHDLVCLAVPATALPAVLAAHGGQITRRLGMLVAGSGLVAPLGT